jgi:hypothetical protein
MKDPVDLLNEALDNAFTIAVEFDMLPVSNQLSLLADDFTVACEKMNLLPAEHFILISHLPNPLDKSPHRADERYIHCMVLVSPLFLTTLAQQERDRGLPYHTKPVWMRLVEAGLTAAIYNSLGKLRERERRQ